MSTPGGPHGRLGGFVRALTAIAWMRPLKRAVDSLLYGNAAAAHGAVQVRDAITLQRVQAIWILALLPTALWGVYNTGLQANAALDPAQIASLEGWRHGVLRALGIGYSAESVWACFVHGALYFLPIYMVTYVVGRGWEWLFAAMRGRELDEGFWVTALLFPLILPATTPLWQVALAISWGMVIAKLVFGGTGMNLLNPSLVARAFLFYAYPVQILGDKVWVPVPPDKAIDGFSGATPLMQGRQGIESLTGWDGWWTSFIGLEPGSLGETSALMCLVGAAILVFTRMASWRIMAGVALGTVVAAELMNLSGSATNPAFAIPFWWHMVLGGWAFGAFFLATDPTTSAFTNRGRWIYGFLIGALIVFTRVMNSAYPDSTMLVILFMNVFAPLIDHFVVRSHRRRRLQRHAN
jgi:Na+-transporting NADH:ubiquinone oxidoreductase subunit B